ncbi:hypothetical protein I79_005330 [Cricetulus griseus]|uniref:Uncharacterized protein n=1 Tax=Cricetulus griseus TaxID=10029 RepID=G3H4W7_CRIGR|nr:hypothetical protein I79_005330 [Cricetulus griseus]
MSKGVRTRLEKSTRTADLNKGLLMDPRLIGGKRVEDCSRPPEGGSQFGGLDNLWGHW